MLSSFALFSLLILPSSTLHSFYLDFFFFLFFFFGILIYSRSFFSILLLFFCLLSSLNIFPVSSSTIYIYCAFLLFFPLFPFFSCCYINLRSTYYCAVLSYPSEPPYVYFVVRFEQKQLSLLNFCLSMRGYEYRVVTYSLSGYVNLLE